MASYNNMASFNSMAASPLFQRSSRMQQGRSGTGSPLSARTGYNNYGPDYGAAQQSAQQFSFNYNPLRNSRQRHQSSGDLMGGYSESGPSAGYDDFRYGTGTLPRRTRLLRQHHSFEGDLYGDGPADRYFEPRANPGLTSSYLGSLSASNIAGGRFPQDPYVPNYGATTGDPLLDHELDSRFGGGNPLSYPSPRSMSYGAGLPPSSSPSALPQYTAVRTRDPYSLPMGTLQKEYDALRREYELAVQKLNSTMTSIKTFWSPELKKERAFRKEETAKLSLLTEQYRLATQDSQKQQAVMRQLTDELQCQYELTRTIRDVDLKAVHRDEYEATRMDRDRLHREVSLMRDTLKELEVQIETQRQTLVSRDDSIKKLLDMLQNKGLMSYSQAQEKLDLEQSRTSVIELENRCRHYEQLIGQRDQDVRSLQDECMNASDKLRQMQTHVERLQAMPPEERDPGAWQQLLDSKDAKIGHLQEQVALLEEDLVNLKEEEAAGRPSRDFTDKSVTDKEYQEMKLKVEKAQMELSSKQQEVQSQQTRLAMAEETAADARRRTEALKEQLESKDHQINMLNSDIDALRQKLENKNEAIEGKTKQMASLQTEKTRLGSEVTSLKEQLSMKDSRVAMMQRKIDSLEDVLREGNQQLEMMRARLSASPNMQQQQQLQEQLEQMGREQERMVKELKLDRDKLAEEHEQQIDAQSREIRSLRHTIDMLQKELADKQVLIESQSTKIEESEQSVASLTDKAIKAAVDKSPSAQIRENEVLKEELHQARMEVERLLKMVKDLEHDKHAQTVTVKELQEKLTETSTSGSGMKRSSAILDQVLRREGELSSDAAQLQTILAQREQRIEELEEALRESVSITAERELAVASQKQLSHAAEARLQQQRDEHSRLRRQLEESENKLRAVASTAGDKDTLIRTLKAERRKHLEEVLELKQEALLAAISEKDAHIALLEMAPSGKPPGEVETLRKHKDKLMRKLKEENAKRIKLLSEPKDSELTAPLAKDLNSSPIDQVLAALERVESERSGLCAWVDVLVSGLLERGGPDTLTGLPRTQMTRSLDQPAAYLMSQQQALSILNEREWDNVRLRNYVNQLDSRLASVSNANDYNAINDAQNNNLRRHASEPYLLVPSPAPQIPQVALTPPQRRRRLPSIATVRSRGSKGIYV